MYHYGWKFLDPTGATHQGGVPFVYNLPRHDEKWSDWTDAPNPAVPDGKDCGPGRLHLMRRPSASYAPHNWWIWYARGDGLVGESNEKFGVHRLQLRRISQRVFWRMIRLGWLSNANLSNANLSNADLSNAYLSNANLRDANLSNANLRDAYLSNANLRDAHLSNANLSNAFHCIHTIWPESFDKSRLTTVAIED